jgi:hypothetical protein
MSSNLNFNVRLFSLFQVNILIIHKQLHAVKQQKYFAIACLSQTLNYNGRYIAAERGITLIARRNVGKQGVNGDNEKNVKHENLLPNQTVWMAEWMVLKFSR